MLYVTTRNTNDAFTAHRALTQDYAPDGGSFVPFRLPLFDKVEISLLKDKTFNQIVAEILNMFFSLRLNGWDLDLCIGKNLLHIAPMNHRIVVAELWRNLGGSFTYIENILYEKLGAETHSAESANWPVIAVKMAVIFGIYGQLLQEELLDPGEPVDFSVQNDDFITPVAIHYCRDMGLPVNTIVCTCEENNNLWDYIHRGLLGTAGISAKLQSAMERLLHATLGCGAVVDFCAACSDNRVFEVAEESLPILNKGLFCSVAGKDRANTVINSLYRTNSYIIDTRAALCYGGLQDYRAKTGASELTVILAENTPLNYIDDITAATGLEIQTIKNISISLKE